MSATRSLLFIALWGATVGCSTTGENGGAGGGGGNGGTVGVAGGTSGNSGVGGGVAGGSGGARPFATTPGDSVFVDGLTRATFVSHGGGLPAFGRPQDAACDSSVWTYTLDIEAGSLTWSVCRVANSGQAAADYTPETGVRTLSPLEQQDAYVALTGVRVSAGQTCGADKPTWDLTVVSPLGMLTYGDDFYACLPIQPRWVESQGLSTLYAVLSPLAHP